MKLSRILVLIFGLCILFSGITFAKTKTVLDSSNPSVQLLKSLNDEGKKLRKNDLPVEMPDITADTIRANQKKMEFQEEKRKAFPSIYKQKNKEKN